MKGNTENYVHLQYRRVFFESLFLSLSVREGEEKQCTNEDNKALVIINISQIAVMD